MNQELVVRDQVLTDKEVRGILKESRTGLFRLRKKGTLKARQRGHRVVYLVSDVNDYLANLPLADEQSEPIVVE